MMDEHDVMILELRQAAYDYAEIVRELRQDASTSRDLYLADAIEALSVECKEWKERGDALGKALNVAFSDFAKIEKNQSWISVTERLPENGERALVMRFDYVTNTPFYDLLWFDKGEWWNRLYTGNYAVTHWMPLPEPPKAEGGIVMNYRVAICVLLSLNDSEKQYDDDTVLDAVEKILSMETINATPKDALLNALRWFWDKTVEEVDPKEEA